MFFSLTGQRSRLPPKAAGAKSPHAVPPPVSDATRLAQLEQHSPRADNPLTPCLPFPQSVAITRDNPKKRKGQAVKSNTPASPAVPILARMDASASSPTEPRPRVRTGVTRFVAGGSGNGAPATNTPPPLAAACSPASKIEPVPVQCKDERDTQQAIKRRRSTAPTTDRADKAKDESVVSSLSARAHSVKVEADSPDGIFKVRQMKPFVKRHGQRFCNAHHVLRSYLLCVCMYVCVCACVCGCLCMCMCLWVGAALAQVDVTLSPSSPSPTRTRTPKTHTKPPSPAEGENVFVVERILSHRAVNSNETEYLIKVHQNVLFYAVVFV
jgi:hypothetical protein